MRYRKLTASGDYSFGNGSADFYRDVPEGVAQAVMTRLRLWSGEWFLDLAEGTPYQQAALGKHTKETADPMIRDRVLNTEGVLSILEYESSFDGETRKFTVNILVDTVYGPAPIIGVL